MKPYQEQSYYELLEVDPTASMAEIRGAYQRALRLYDSDNVALYPVGDPAQVEGLKKLLLEAMEILTDEDLRVEYDRTLGLSGTRRPEPPGPEEIDGRADAAREEADQEHAHEVEARLEPHPAPEAPGPDELDERADTTRELADKEHAHEVEELLEGPAAEPPPPGPEEIDRRADAARGQADQVHAHEVEELIEHPAPEAGAQDAPAQLEMEEVVFGAQTLHSTEPRYTVSYLPRAPLPPPPSDAIEVNDAEIRPVGEALTGSRGAPPAEPPPAPGPAQPVAPPAPRGREYEKAQHIAQEEAIATAESALAQVSAQLPHRPRPAAGAPASRPRVEVGPDAIYSGELFRQVREGRGLSLRELADKTRIGKNHLENLEADRYEALPATVYLRGILMNVARELGLDPLRAAKSYLTLVEKALGRQK